MTRRPSTTGPSTTGLAATLPSCATTVSTTLRAWSVWTARIGHQQRLAVPPLASRMLPNMPGVRK